jgi:hypothetical protein
MDYVYAVHATESDGSRRYFEHTQDEPLGVGGPLEDHQREGGPTAKSEVTNLAS